MGTSTDATFDGIVTTGTQLNPGSMKLATTWSFDDQTGLWVVTGTWRATRTDGLDNASGSFSGTWKPSTGAFNASAVMLRHAMVVPGRELLTGDVEVDETFVGGPDGAQGRRLGKKALVVIGAEVRGTATGRIRLARIPDASHASLEGFITG